MDTQFNAEFFAGNREKLRSLFTGTAPIVLTANGLLQRNNDVTFPFRQDSSFWYFTGITEPDVVLVMDKVKEYIIVPERDASRQAFDGAIDTELLSRISGVETVLEGGAGWKQLGARLKRVKHVATLGSVPDYADAHGMYTNPARNRFIALLKSYNQEIELLDLRPHISRMRMIKQPIERAAIEHSIALTVSALQNLKKRGWNKFEYEYEIEAALTHTFLKKQATHAYSPIIASGANACTLHYVRNNTAIAQDSFILFDVGAESNQYAADITRTYAVGEVSKRHRAVHEATIAVQDFALSYLKPGVTMRQFEDEVQQYMGEKLRELGLIRSIESDEVRKYYPHATSHFLGLDVHDVGDYDRPLEPGVVMTVEPGIYIPEEGIGVRIEDNIIITEDGIDNLSAKLPRSCE